MNDRTCPRCERHEPILDPYGRPDGVVVCPGPVMIYDEYTEWTGVICPRCEWFEEDRPTDGSRIQGPSLPDRYPAWMWPIEIREDMLAHLRSELS